MRFPRSAGILLHPTSLPGRFGIGDLGPDAVRWLDWLAGAGQTLWQILPLGPTGFGDSPYQCFSAFAGNPLLVSPDGLRADGLLEASDLEAAAHESPRVDFGAVIPRKLALLDAAHARFAGGSGPGALHAAYDAYCAEQSAWLDDFALFMAIKEAQGGHAWTAWPRPLARREPGAIAGARRSLAAPIDAQRFRQFVFDRQWSALRDHARERGIRVLGDVPIFVAHDSADVWSHPEWFDLRGDGTPRVVAGVPPDYFSETGQLWGNPLYRWDAMRASGFSWWCARLRRALANADLVRLDHFRGFVAHWEVPAGDATAAGGRWVEAPGRALFDALRGALGGLPLVAEDLGVITPEVDALREAFDLPGMRVLQFAFGAEGTSPYLPHLYTQHTVCYTGTHDNDTTRGWYEHGATERERDHARRYLGRDGREIVWDLIRLGMSSVAHTFVAPLQDVLDLSSEARMNQPAHAAGNWAWRFHWTQLGGDVQPRLRELTDLYGRGPAARMPR